MPTRPFRLVAVGSYSLREAAQFGFGQRDPHWDGVMRLAFCLDGGFDSQVGVELTQDGPLLSGRITGDGDAEAIRRQVARVLSVDRDARGYDDLLATDPVLRRAAAAAPGLRPPLFYSPYEAACWSVLSTRRPRAVATRIRTKLSREAGTVFDLAGTETAALPTPEQMLRVAEFPGLEPVRLTRLHAIARAAMSGELEADRLQAMGPEAAMAQLRTLPGIGAFYASLITIRATGFADVLPVDERKVLTVSARLHGLDDLPSQAEWESIAQAWRPWRTWACVLLRVAGGRLPASGAAA
jgi:DNA-3-methyladenine glycosylase II